VLDRSQRPFFRRREGRVDEGLAEIDMAAVAEIFGEPLQQAIESAAALPELKATMAGLIGRIAAREIRPRRAGAQHPEHTVEHGPRIDPRAAAPVSPPRRAKDRFEYRPLGVREIHAARYDVSRSVVTRRSLGL